MTGNRPAIMLTAFVIIGTALSAAGFADEEDGWIPLFNGKDLSGWEIFSDPDADAEPDDIWKVEDGIIQCDGGVNGYLITQDEYDNYILRLQWRWGEKVTRSRNSGVFVHVVGPNKIWPQSVEAQLMAEHAGDFWLVDGADLDVDHQRRDPNIDRHYFRMRDDVEKPLGEWNQYEIICQDSTVVLIVNDHLVNVGTNSHPNRGRILLQSEGGRNPLPQHRAEAARLEPR